MTGPIFSFDARFCSGCKACQVACKDHNGLEVGRLWRRVYEVNGGSGWQTSGVSGSAWAPDVGVYFLSISCNHCEQPICVEVCPTGAMYKRPDGLVLIDEKRCIGCQYCAWACPYGAPQYDPRAGQVTKCNFCMDELKAGNPPACVAACPMRVLETSGLPTIHHALSPKPEHEGGSDHLHSSLLPIFEEEERRGRGEIRRTPLPSDTLTQPGLIVRSHAAAGKPGPKRVANHEETGVRHHHEKSLMLFTLLAPAAVGLFIVLGLLSRSGFLIRASEQALPAGWPQDWATVWAGWLPFGLMALGMIASLWHLGRPLHAWQALRRPYASWLSREIWLAGLTAGGMLLWAISGSGDGLTISPLIRSVLFGVTALCGLGLLYTLGRVYCLRTVPQWDTAWMQAGPYLTALAIGGLGAAWVVSIGSDPPGGSLAGRFGALTSAALIARWFIGWRLAVRSTGIDPGLKQVQPDMQLDSLSKGTHILRAHLIQAVIAAIAAIIGAVFSWTMVLGLAIILTFSSEWDGRSEFYALRPE